MKVNSQRHQFAIYCHFELGPTFGNDIFIDNNANTTWDSLSRLGFAYKHPQFAHGSNEADTFFAGSIRFQLDEIEIYQKE
jgi:hypothetical protein